MTVQEQEIQLQEALDSLKSTVANTAASIKASGETALAHQAASYEEQINTHTAHIAALQKQISDTATAIGDFNKSLLSQIASAAV